MMCLEAENCTTRDPYLGGNHYLLAYGNPKERELGQLLSPHSKLAKTVGVAHCSKHKTLIVKLRSVKL